MEKVIIFVDVKGLGSCVILVYLKNWHKTVIRVNFYFDLHKVVLVQKKKRVLQTPQFAVSYRSVSRRQF